MSAVCHRDPNAVQEGSQIGDRERLRNARHLDSQYDLPPSIPNAAFKASPGQSTASQWYAAPSHMQPFS